jgi:hypothetical protein
LRRRTEGLRRRASAAGIPEAVTAATREPRFEIIERADAEHRAGTLSHPLTHDAAACTNQRYADDATGDKLQIERGGFEPHYSQPRKSNVELKYGAHRLLNADGASGVLEKVRNIQLERGLRHSRVALRHRV